ncbi:hypothetical protein BKA64DRAFT_111980 [Cadophora sp. MPI-SDFR-AT-0126]|nr:hypothetical protein BKA64DRAFT_111980 [Leotiomycetes sp. MPI-SDFR-AT-0126]
MTFSWSIEKPPIMRPCPLDLAKATSVSDYFLGLHCYSEGSNTQRHSRDGTFRPSIVYCWRPVFRGEKCTEGHNCYCCHHHHHHHHRHLLLHLFYGGRCSAYSLCVSVVVQIGPSKASCPSQAGNISEVGITNFSRRSAHTVRSYNILDSCFPPQKAKLKFRKSVSIHVLERGDGRSGRFGIQQRHVDQSSRLGKSENGLCRRTEIDANQNRQRGLHWRSDVGTMYMNSF